MRLTGSRLRFRRRRGRALQFTLAAVGVLVVVAVGWFGIVQPRVPDSKAAERTAASTTATSLNLHTDNQSDSNHSEQIPAAPRQPTQVIDVQLTDVAIKPNPIAIATGATVRFSITNQGTVVHEFRLTNGHDVEEHLVTDRVEPESGDHTPSGSAVVAILDPGETREVDVEFPTDRTTFTMAACLIRGHYEAGMWSSITYEPAD